jgi:transketolase
MTTKPKATRQSFGETLAELGEKYSKVVVLDADLAKSTKSEMFAKKFPHRFFEMGIAEANMIGTGAGLAFEGYVPFICSFGCFVTGRYDQIRLSVAYSQAGVRIIGTHAGVGIGDDGHSQMGLEDVSLMRGLPTMAVLQPGDDIETKQMIEFLMQGPQGYNGPAYVRLTRQNLKPVHGEGYRFQFGKIDILKSGQNIALLASGAGVQEAMAAAEIMTSKGVAAPTVVNVHTIKPFDRDGVLRLAQTHKHFITVEDHSVIGGLGSAVAEVLAEAGSAVRLTRVGVQDLFGESGEPIELYEKHGLTAEKIAGLVL